MLYYVSMIQLGQVAPDFLVQDINGREISLSSLKGKNVLLSFFRYAGCPWCNLAIHRLAEVQDKFRNENVTIVSFVQSTKENIEKNIMARHDPKPYFSIVADHERRVYDLYEVKDSAIAAIRSLPDIPDWLQSTKQGYTQTTIDGSLMLVPAQFVIDPRGIVISSHYGKNYNDTMTFIEIKDILTFGRDQTIA